MHNTKTNSSCKSAVYTNLYSTLRIFSSLDHVRSDNVSGELLLYDNGVDAAYENYALTAPSFVGPRDEASRLVEHGLSFFSESGRAHIWPLFPGVSSHFTDILEELGIKSDSTFYAMDKTLDAGQNQLSDAQEKETVKVEDDSDAHEWADAAWYGFDSEEAAPDVFVNFIKRASKHKEIILSALRSTEPPHEMAATGMLTLTRGEAGIYYVATRPDFRRMGFAAKVMNSLFSHALKHGYRKVCLLATPEGRDFYKRIGFIERYETDIRVCEDPSVLPR